MSALRRVQCLRVIDYDKNAANINRAATGAGLGVPSWAPKLQSSTKQ